MQEKRTEMMGCLGRDFQVTIAGSFYQREVAGVTQGRRQGMFLTEREIYADSLLRKPRADELSYRYRGAVRTEDPKQVDAAQRQGYNPLVL